MAITVQQFLALPSPATNDNNFGLDNIRGFYDVGGAHDLVMPCATTVNNAVQWFTSKTPYSVAPVKVASDFTTPSGTFPNFVRSCIQTPDGSVHILSFDTTSIPYYTRCILVRDGSGHVTGVTIDQAPIALLGVSTPVNPYDYRGCLEYVTVSGTNYVVWIANGYYSSNTTVRVYGGYISGLSGTTTSVGLTGSGTSTLMISRTDDGFYNTEACFLLAIERTSGNICVFDGGQNTDFYQGTTTAGTLTAITVTVFMRSSLTWGSGAATTIYDIPGSAEDQPVICGVASAAGKALLLYYKQANLQVGYVDSSGTWHASYLTSISTTSSKAYSGVAATDGTQVWVWYAAYGTPASGPTITANFLYNDGVGGGWQSTADSSPATLENIFSISMPTGLAIFRANGSVNSVSNTGFSLGVIFFAPLAIAIQPTAQVAKINTQANFTVTATSGISAVTLQWKIDTGAGYVNVGTNSTSYLTKALQLVDACNVKVTVTDSAGSTDSNVVTLSVYDLPPQDAQYVRRKRSARATFPQTAAGWW